MTKPMTRQQKNAIALACLRAEDPRGSLDRALLELALSMAPAPNPDNRPFLNIATALSELSDDALQDCQPTLMRFLHALLLEPRDGLRRNDDPAST